MESAGKTAPVISIVLPVRNESKYIGQVLQDLADQDFPREDFEVVVVDGQSTDDTRAIASEFSNKFERLMILENPRLLSSAARNIGLRASSGEFIFFIDGHCSIPSRRLIADTVDLFRRYNADALCRPGPQTAEPQTYFQRAVSLVRSSNLGHALDSTIYFDRDCVVPASSSGAAYRRRVFDKVGDFDESFDACEDVEFNTRIDKAGLKSVISPRLTIKSAPRENLAGLFRQLHRYGYGRWKLFRKHPSTLGVGTLIPVFFVLGLGALPFLWLMSRKAGMIVSVPYAIYLIAITAASIVLAGKNSKPLVLVMPFIYVTVHVAYGLGFIVAALRSQR